MDRRVVALALCLALVGLAVAFGVQFAGSDAYPDPAAIDADYATHVGETVHLWGRVVATSDGSVVLGFGTLELRVTEPPPSAVEPGDLIQVYGQLRPDRRFDTVAYHAVSLTRQTYMYGVSVVGGTVAAGAFLYRWRIDRDGWQFVPREGE